MCISRKIFQAGIICVCVLVKLLIGRGISRQLCIRRFLTAISVCDRSKYTQQQTVKDTVLLFAIAHRTNHVVNSDQRSIQAFKLLQSDAQQGSCEKYGQTARYTAPRVNTVIQAGNTKDNNDMAVAWHTDRIGNKVQHTTSKH